MNQSCGVKAVALLFLIVLTTKISSWEDIGRLHPRLGLSKGYEIEWQVVPGGKP